MNTGSTPLLIAGTGAMACLFAARLSAAGISVALLGTWPEGLKALEQKGVTLVESDGREMSFPIDVIHPPERCGNWRYALVLVKSWQTARAATQLAACLDEDGLAVTLQNGFGNGETLAAALGPARVGLGTTTAGATLLGPGKVRAAGEGQISLEAQQKMGPLADMLRLAGFAVELRAEVKALLWGKLVINAAINPLTALLRVPNGELLERPAARSLLTALAVEAAAVAAAQGINLPYDDPAAAAEAVARRTAANRSSMLQDIERGAPTEIDAISGAVVRMGAQAGVPTPLNETCWKLVQALSPLVEAQAAQAGHSIQPDRAAETGRPF